MIALAIAAASLEMLAMLAITPGGMPTAFAFVGPPTISAISPNAGEPGTGFGAIITGTDLTGATSVAFSGSGITAYIGSGGTSTTLPITISIDPSAPLGLQTLTVFTSQGPSAPFSGFTVTTEPTVTGIFPNSAAQGSSRVIQLVGISLTGASAVTFSGSGVSTVVLFNGGSSGLSLLVAIAQDAPTGPRTLTVTTPQGTTSPFSGLTVTKDPWITAISPNGGPPGVAIGSTISGVNLTGASAVTFSGSGVTASLGSGTPTSTILPVTISIAPDAPLGQQTLTVTTPEGTSVPFNGFTVALPPTITGLDPDSAGQGAFTRVILTGTNLTGASAVTFIGSSVSAFVATAYTATMLPIFVSVAQNAPLGLHNLTVTTFGGTSSEFSGFNVTLVPVAKGITPRGGPPGATLGATINGVNLTGASAVTFSGSGVTATIDSGGTSTTLPVTISIAADAPLGFRTLTVTTPEGTSSISSAFFGFTVAELPAITAITPNSGPAGGAFGAILTGTALTGVSAVTFSGSGVTANIGTGGTSTTVPITMSLKADAAVGVRTVTVTTVAGDSLPFSSFTVTPSKRRGQVTSAKLIQNSPVRVAP